MAMSDSHAEMREGKLLIMFRIRNEQSFKLCDKSGIEAEGGYQ